jgi:hypothetical protein
MPGPVVNSRKPNHGNGFGVYVHSLVSAGTAMVHTCGGRTDGGEPGEAVTDLMLVVYHQPVDLSCCYNNIGMTGPGDKVHGAFNVWRNSLPAEELPQGRRITLADVPFDFPRAESGRPDNVRCAAQLLRLPSGRYDWLWLLAAGERRVEDEVAIHYADGALDFVALRVSDFWSAEPAFGEWAALRTERMHYPHHVQPGVPGVIWSVRVPLCRRGEVSAARLPDNPAVHIFAATLAGATPWLL